MNKFLALGAIFGMLGVMIGAFGAHGLENMLSAHALQRYHTGVTYQFYHAAALLVVGVLSINHTQSPRSLTLSGIFFVLGIFLFSGSLYLYALTGVTYFGMITPVGGICFITAWISLIVYAVKHTDDAQLIHKQ